jgi:NAD+ synthase (glutamine-hydrolysing)
MRIALAQLNPVVGDIDGNLGRIRQTLEQLRSGAPDLVVLPEMFLTGYPPRDLLEQRWFIERCQKGLKQLVELSMQHPEVGILTGAVVQTGQKTGNGLYNAAVLVVSGRQVGMQPKTLLPAYDVFDELRYFDPAPSQRTFSFAGETLGVSVCEDAWTGSDGKAGRKYSTDPIGELARSGATLLVNISASPFSVGKDIVRHRILGDHCRRHRLPLVYVNQVGGNDELVFDGGSMVLDSSGTPIEMMGSFVEQVTIVDTADSGAGEFLPQEAIGSVYRALVLGLHDYVHKCGFSRVVLGLSGGVDSAVACCVAVEALGVDNVLGVTMPSEFSSAGSVGDSRLLAANLGIRFEQVAITQVYDCYREVMKSLLEEGGTGVTEENIQARVRGNILMAISNKLGHMVVSTGNKSELAVGYCTLYGDMSGGLAVLADVPKTMVYELARHINRDREIIPRAIIQKPPSAELKPGQKDQDTLPPYEMLDDILRRWLEEGESVEEVANAGHNRATVEWVVQAVKANEYKRRQAVPGIRVTGKAFGSGRRFPIAAKY